jgi:hypothetical protein
MPSRLAPLPSGEGETEEFIFSDNNEVSFKNYTTSDKAYQKAQEFFEFDPTQ